MASHALYDVLPSELMLMILSHLLPHQLTGFALSCRHALGLTDLSVNERFSTWKSPAQSATLRWTLAFYKLSTETQAAMELIFAVTPRSIISFPRDHKTCDLYLAMASMYRFSQDGAKVPSLRFIEISSKVARRAENPQPDLIGLVERCWDLKLGDLMKKAEEYAERGLDDPTLRYVEAANKLALKAGRSLPDSRALVTRCWEVKLIEMMNRAEEYAQRGLHAPVTCCIEKANESALKAGVPLPDSNRVLQRCLKMKLGAVV